MRPGFVSPLFFALLLVAACAMPDPLVSVGNDDGTHGGWGVDRVRVAQSDSTAEDGATEPAEAEAPPVAAAEPPPQRIVDRPAPPESQPETRRSPERTQNVTPPSDDTPGSSVAEQPSRSEASSQTVLNRISVAQRSDGRGLVVRLHTDGHVPAYRVEDEADGRVSISLFQTRASSIRPSDPSGPIRGIRVEQDGSRAVVRLELDPDVSIVPQAYPDRDSDDLLLSLTFAQRATIAPPPPPPATNANGNGNNGEHWRLDCIVIDAGHGGHDPGTVHDDVRESDVNLAISLRLGRMLEENLGIQVVYTRTDDRFIELAERGQIANRSCGKLFVSIHANSAANRSAQGTETYFLGMHRTERAREVMERENSVIALESDPSLYSGRTEAALIMQTMAQATYLRTSEQLAGLIEGQFEGFARRRSRGVKQAGFLVLWGASMPAVLVETGFISNNEEARFLSSTRGQEQIAESIYRAIREYKSQYERSLGLATN